MGQVSIPLGDVRGGTARSRVDTCMLNVYRNRRAIFQSSCACLCVFSPRPANPPVPPATLLGVSRPQCFFLEKPSERGASARPAGVAQWLGVDR